MDKKLIDRLIIVADNLRDIEDDLMIDCARGFTRYQDLISKLGIELDILDSIIDGLQQEIKQ